MAPPAVLYVETKVVCLVNFVSLRMPLLSGMCPVLGGPRKVTYLTRTPPMLTLWKMVLPPRQSLDFWLKSRVPPISKVDREDLKLRFLMTFHLKPMQIITREFTGAVMQHIVTLIVLVLVPGVFFLEQ